jgi:hypothetical protein
MAVRTYGSGPYNPNSPSTASNQNTIANNLRTAGQNQTASSNMQPWSTSQYGQSNASPWIAQQPTTAANPAAMQEAQRRFEQQYAQNNASYAAQAAATGQTPIQGGTSTVRGYNNPWSITTQNPYSAAQPGGTGPYNPNMPQQQPGIPSPYTPGQYTPPTQQVPQFPSYPQGTPPTQQTWPNPNNSAGAPWGPADFNTQALRDQYTAYMQASLPYMQFMQNNYQYGQDFAEQQRRFNWQQGNQDLMNQFNMGITNRQMGLQEWATQEQANQWGAELNRNLYNDQFSQGLANRQLDSQNWYQQAQINLGNRQAQIEEEYNQGRLSNEQRQIALAELAQSQDNAWQYFQLARQQELSREQQANQLGFDRDQLAATIANNQMNYQLSYQQMAQQMEQQRLQLEADRQNAILQATGRAGGQGPNSQWMRRF